MEEAAPILNSVLNILGYDVILRMPNLFPGTGVMAISRRTGDRVRHCHRADPTGAAEVVARREANFPEHGTRRHTRFARCVWVKV